MDCKGKGPYKYEDPEKRHEFLEPLKLKVLSRRMNFLYLLMSYPMKLLDHNRLEMWSKDFLCLVDILRKRNAYISGIIPTTVNRLLGEWPELTEVVQSLIGADFFAARLEQLTKKSLVTFPEVLASTNEVQKRSPDAELFMHAPQGIPKSVGAGSTDSETWNVPHGGLELVDYSSSDEEILRVQQEIMNLANDLAVEQLVQNLINGDAHYFRVSTRNTAMELYEKIEKTLTNRSKVPDAASYKFLFINSSKCQRNEDLQQQILKQVQLHVGVDDNFFSCDNIMRELTLRKYLIIFEGTGAKLDLNGVLPVHGFDGAIVFVTGTHDVDIGMVVDLEIKAEDHLLSWELFCHIVGSNLQKSPTILKTATSIVKECHGHLLALRLVGEHLKHKLTFESWAIALRKIHASNTLCEMEGRFEMSKVMFSAFAFVWEEMDNTRKHCLARCLSYPRMIRQGVEPGFLTSEWNSISYGANDILQWFLSNGCLLLVGNLVRLPEEIKDILELLCRSVKQPYLEVFVPPADSMLWQQTEEIFLVNNTLSELPDSPKCSELKKLYLQGNTNLTVIPPAFFSQMPLLSILDLSYTAIQVFPESFYQLPVLQELILKGCELFWQLPPEISTLKSLRKLHLEGTRIECLPTAVRRLTNLTSLHLSFEGYDSCHEQEMMASYADKLIPPNVLPELKQLTDLSLDVKPGDKRWDETADVIIREVCTLSNLTNLKIYVPCAGLLMCFDEASFKQYLPCDFQFIVGYHSERAISRVPPEVEAVFQCQHRSLRFVNGIDIPSELKKVIPHSYAFFLDRHITIKSLSEFGNGIEWLRHCFLSECNEMQTIFDGKCNSLRFTELGYLQYMVVYFMKNLRSIWEGPMHNKYLCNLKFLRLNTCPEMRTVFTLNLLPGLENLEELIVEDCPQVEHIVTHAVTEKKTDVYLFKLKRITLLFLDGLVSISCGLCIAPDLEKICFYDCPKLESLSRAEMSSNKLKVIQGETQWWDALKWDELEWGSELPPVNLRCIFVPIDDKGNLWRELEAEKFRVLHQNSPQVKSALATKAKRRYASTNEWSRLCTSAELDDGYSWRKCGQKVIRDSRFPRSYFRCTHCRAPGCKARKHVQQLDDQPDKFEVRYSGKHTSTNVVLPRIAEGTKEPLEPANMKGDFSTPIPSVASLESFFDWISEDTASSKVTSLEPLDFPSP